MSAWPRITGVVLAAGASRRLGRPKQLLPLAGRPLLQHVLDAAADAASLAEIIVVLGHAAEEVRSAVALPARTRVVVNARHADGQSTSLACGLAAAAPDATAAVVLLGDQPHVTAALIDAVTGAGIGGDDRAVRPVWTAADGTRRPGHPVVLPRALWSRCETLVGDRGARAFFDAHPEAVRELPFAGTPPADVDDEDDYQRLAALGASARGG